jgi:PAS domain-containing protein
VGRAAAADHADDLHNVSRAERPPTVGARVQDLSVDLDGDRTFVDPKAAEIFRQTRGRVELDGFAVYLEGYHPASK